MSICTFIPPYLLERIAARHDDSDVSKSCRHTLTVDAAIRGARAGAKTTVSTATAAGPAFATAP